MSETKSEANDICGKRFSTKTFAGCALSVGALVVGFAGAFLFKALPEEGNLKAVPVTLLLLAICQIILAVQSVSKPATAGKIATFSSITFWIVGILLNFKLSVGSFWISLPDGCLLVGFLPLLYNSRYSWMWLVFGVFNGAIGFFLQMIVLMTDSDFPNAALSMKHHLAQYHEPLVWMVVGIFAIVFGVLHLIKNLFCLMRAVSRSK